MTTIKSFKKGKKQAKIELNGFTVDELIRVLQEEKKKKEEKSKIIYDKLQSIYESEDKKAIIFSFENGNKFKLNLPDSKFYHLHNNKLINFKDFILKERDISPDRMSTVSKETWIKTFFNLANNFSCFGRGQLSDIVDMCLYKNQRKKIVLFEQASKLEFIQNLGDEELSLLSDMLGDDCFKINEVIKNKKDYLWFFENYSNVPVNINHYELDSFVGIFTEAKKAGCLEYLKYAFDNYRYVFVDGHEWAIIKYLINNNYEAKRLITYVCRDMPNQGIEYYDHGSDIHSLYLLRDYVRMNIQMKNDFEKYPRYLRTYHDITVKNYTVAKNRSFNARVKRVAKALEKYHYKNDVYSVISPQSAEDLIEEGFRLSHCVASYIQDFANKETAILFIRKNNDLKNPLVTMEIKNNKIVQAKGKNNSNPQAEEMKFINEYKNYLAKIK